VSVLTNSTSVTGGAVFGNGSSSLVSPCSFCRLSAPSGGTDNNSRRDSVRLPLRASWPRGQTQA
jgi:hypothetical protein